MIGGSLKSCLTFRLLLKESSFYVNREGRFAFRRRWPNSVCCWHFFVAFFFARHKEVGNCEFNPLLRSLGKLSGMSIYCLPGTVIKQLRHKSDRLVETRSNRKWTHCVLCLGTRDNHLALKSSLLFRAIITSKWNNLCTLLCWDLDVSKFKSDRCAQVWTKCHFLRLLMPDKLGICSVQFNYFGCMSLLTLSYIHTQVLQPNFHFKMKPYKSP